MVRYAHRGRVAIPLGQSNELRTLEYSIWRTSGGRQGGTTENIQATVYPECVISSAYPPRIRCRTNLAERILEAGSQAALMQGYNATLCPSHLLLGAKLSAPGATCSLFTIMTRASQDAGAYFLFAPNILWLADGENSCCQHATRASGSTEWCRGNGLTKLLWIWDRVIMGSVTRNQEHDSNLQFLLANP